MSEKTIYLKLNERCKRIKISVSPDVPDLKLMEDTIRQVCKKDAVLNAMICNKFLVFQMEDQNKVLCDIEEEDDIPNESIVHVIAIPVIDMSANLSVKNNNSVCKQFYNLICQLKITELGFL